MSRSKEYRPIPTGNLPTPPEELEQRIRYFDLSNPIYSHINNLLKANGERRGQQNLTRNLVAFFYGVDFYNSISCYPLYFPDTKPPIIIENLPNFPIAIYVSDWHIHVNLAKPTISEEMRVNPMKKIDLYEDYPIIFPAYVVNIINGLEEANHLHLDILHNHRGSNHCQDTNHRRPRQLWRNSDDNPQAYRAKLWHEFAALVIHRLYANLYLKTEFPSETSEFNEFFESVHRQRHKWIKQKRKS